MLSNYKANWTLMRFVALLLGACLPIARGTLLAQVKQPSPGSYQEAGETYQVSYEIDQARQLGGPPWQVAADQGASFRLRILIEPRPNRVLEAAFSNTAGVEFERTRGKFNLKQEVRIRPQPDLRQEKPLAIQFSLFEVGGGKVAGPFSFSIRLNVPTAKASLSDCEQTLPREKLACLTRNLSEFSTADRSLAEKQIADLEAERSAVAKFLDGFQQRRISTSGTFQIMNPDSYKLEVTAKSNQIRIKENPNKTTVELRKGGTYTLDLASTDWPDLGKRTITIAYRESAAPSTQPQDEESGPSPSVESEPISPIPANEESRQPEDPKGEEVPAPAPEPDDTEGDMLPFLLLGGGAVLAILLFAFRKRSKSPAPSVSHQAHTDTASSPQIPPEMPDSHKSDLDSDPELVPESHHADDPSDDELDIDIVEHEEAADQISKLSHDELVTHHEYLPVPLDHHWARTQVRQIFIHHESIEAINQMVQDQNHFTPTQDLIEDIPEIGGFLLGHIYPLEGEKLDVSIEKFVPITAESQSRYTVKFGGQAWSELDDNLRALPGIKLIGWFHTHPGHGLFLSEADLREHYALFTQPHQIAMEIDPLSTGSETAFFTWQDAKTMNNAEDRLTDQWWFFEDLLQDSKTRLSNLPD